jgi:ABC-type branched-subunit amino acid transport system ATPase component
MVGTEIFTNSSGWQQWMATAEIMAKLDGLEAVLDFLKGLQPKIVAQIAKKVMSLSLDPWRVTAVLSPSKFVMPKHP